MVEAFCNHASDSGKVCPPHHSASLRRANCILTSPQPILAIKPLKKALLRSNPAQFSFMHTLFTRLCLQGRCYRDAIPILDVDVFDFPASKGVKDDLNWKGFEVVYKDVLEFYFFGAIIYMGTKKWRRAMDYLCHVCSLYRVYSPRLTGVFRSSHTLDSLARVSRCRPTRSLCWLGCCWMEKWDFCPPPTHARLADALVDANTTQSRVGCNYSYLQGPG